jgi:hypothetical protein
MQLAIQVLLGAAVLVLTVVILGWYFTPVERFPSPSSGRGSE